jgi:hypothetical protein
MTDPTPLPSAQRLEAQAKLKARDDGIRANAIKQGYAQRDAHWHKALGVASMAEATEVAHLRKELKAATAPETLLHATRASHRGGMVVGAAYGIALALIAGAAFAWILSGFGDRMVTTGAAIGSSNPTPIYTCQAGERAPDGHTCGLPHSP